MKADVHFWSYLAQFFSDWGTFHTKFVGKIRTHILCSVTFSLKSYRLLDNVEKIIVERCRPQMKIRRMRIAWWIPKAKNIHSEYVMFITFPLQRSLHKRASSLSGSRWSHVHYVQDDSVARGPKQILGKVFQNLEKRIQVCSDVKGDQFQHRLWAGPVLHRFRYVSINFQGIISIT